LKLLEMHLHLRYYDYHRTMMHPSVWNAFVAVMRQGWLDACASEPSPSIAELVEAWQLFYRLMLPLAVDTRRFDLTHSTAAAFCGLPCVVAKLRRGTPYLLTEHSVYLRNQYLNLADASGSLFVRWSLGRLTRTIVDVNYAFADQISPVCEDNARWERWRGVDSDRIRVIYNGADPRTFGPGPRERHDQPTVVSVGTISPHKGQLDLIEAAALVRRAVPGVRFRFHGAVADQAYYRRCQDLVHALGLGDMVTFEDTGNPAPALQQADVVALSSVSAAFP
jgi:glycosyltransferase involved in cell wall biosynthesis